MKRISLVLLTISAVLLELAGLALVVPLLLLLLEEGGISGNEYLNRFYPLNVRITEHSFLSYAGW